MSYASWDDPYPLSTQIALRWTTKFIKITLLLTSLLMTYILQLRNWNLFYNMTSLLMWSDFSDYIISLHLFILHTIIFTWLRKKIWTFFSPFWIDPNSCFSCDWQLGHMWLFHCLTCIMFYIFFFFIDFIICNLFSHVNTILGVFPCHKIQHKWSI